MKTHVIDSTAHRQLHSVNPIIKPLKGVRQFVYMHHVTSKYTQSHYRYVVWLSMQISTLGYVTICKCGWLYVLIPCSGTSQLRPPMGPVEVQ